jgi:hypothetical protein
MIIDKSNVTSVFYNKFAKDFFISNTLSKNIFVYVNREQITVELKNYNQDANTWDGEMIIHFVKKMSTKDIINHLVAFSFANEISMETTKKLRLWWD